MLHDNWQGKPYYSLDAWCKERFHHKCYKVALNAHMTCPNRDGTLGTRGCIFCSAGGSGDFAVDTAGKDIETQLAEGIRLIAAKLPRTAVEPTHTGAQAVAAEPAHPDTQAPAAEPAHPGTQAPAAEPAHPGIQAPAAGTPCIIAYFQAYTNTYGPVSYLREIFSHALESPLVCGISIATRPDCLPEEVLSLLAQLKGQFPGKFIWVELGLQTMHEKTADFIRRGYRLPCFEKAFFCLRRLDIPVIVHVILGLPGESENMTLETIQYLNSLRPFGIKLQLLHILKDTDLAAHFVNGEFDALTKEEYLDILITCLENLSPGIVVHRVTGDGPKKLLLAPLWSSNKRDVLNSLHRRMRERDSYQGKLFSEDFSGENVSIAAEDGGR